MTTSPIDLKRSDRLARLTLNLPNKANALDREVLGDLEEKLAIIEADKSIRVVLLTGAGERFFCAGGAFDDWGQLSPQSMGRDFIRMTNRVIDRLEMLDALTLAWLNGDTIGGGLELALAADLRIAHPRARLYLPELTIGAVPGMRGVGRLTSIVGQGRAKEMVLCGRRLDAKTALNWGLVSEIEAELAIVEKTIVEMIAALSGDALATAKQMFRLLAGGPASAHAIHEIAGSFSKFTEEGREGVSALMQKRKPDFHAAGEGS